MTEAMIADETKLRLYAEQLRTVPNYDTLPNK
jgi:hypothetical protein